MVNIWSFSLAECLACGHTWIGVHPLDCPPLECPACGSKDTVRENTIEEDDDVVE